MGKGKGRYWRREDIEGRGEMGEERGLGMAEAVKEGR